MRDKRYDPLFAPLSIGPVVAKNRFYQVPHCSGMGQLRPRALAAMRGMKAAGGWGVVCTEYTSVHPSSDDLGFPCSTLWNADDQRAHQLMVDAVHEHDSLAGVELWLGGNFISNLATRIPPLGIQSRPPTDCRSYHPVQSRRIDRKDIRDIRKWQVTAARRAAEVGFDIVYVYAAHGYLLSEFLNSKMNTRSDEYGGSAQNRSRLLRELIVDTKEAVGDRCAVAVRFALNEGEEDCFEIFSELSQLPDLWDLTVADYSQEMGSSRFVKQGAQEKVVAAARKLTSKPVVTVGRFTSPDMMAEMLQNGVQDLIGAARPSIADPFLPEKIRTGRIDDIRECIGCNICYAHDTFGVPIRCTQNPTMGEEWRLGWHPEKLPSCKTTESVLVVGAGPAGLEAARVLGERGFRVMLAERLRELGGRVRREAGLTGLSEWMRVRDWRLTQIAKCSNIEVFPESHIEAKDVLELDVQHVFVATGSSWSVCGIGRHSNIPFSRTDDARILTADQIIDGHRPEGRVLIYDDDHHYIGAVLALHLAKQGVEVGVATPLGRLSQWGAHLEEQPRSMQALLAMGVDFYPNRCLNQVVQGSAVLNCIFGGQPLEVDADVVIPITRREPNDSLYYQLLKMQEDNPKSSGRINILRIGDCEAPGMIASAVYSGYNTAIQLGATANMHKRSRREYVLPA